MKRIVTLIILVTALCSLVAIGQPEDPSIRETAVYKQAAEYMPTLLTEYSRTYRNRLGLGWSALTNTNSSTHLLGYTLSSGIARIQFVGSTLRFTNSFEFQSTVDRDKTRVNFGFSTNLNSIWTATTKEAARTNIGLGWNPLTNNSYESFLLASGIASQTNGDFTILNHRVPATQLYAAPKFEGSGTSYGYGTVDPMSVLFYVLFDDGVGSEPPGYADGWYVYDNTNFRSAIGLGSGITTNRTFISYDGTNYTTNSVSISNGIITGWTQ